MINMINKLSKLKVYTMLLMAIAPGIATASQRLQVKCVADYGHIVSSKGIDYSGHMAVDGDWNTSWQINIIEWMNDAYDPGEYDFSGPLFRVSADKIDYIKIFNGSGRGIDAWQENCRAKKVLICRRESEEYAEIEPSDIIFEGSIDDVFGMQQLDVSSRFDNSRPTKYIQIFYPAEMSGYHVGDRFYDLPLTEFEVYGESHGAVSKAANSASRRISILGVKDYGHIESLKGANYSGAMATDGDAATSWQINIPNELSKIDYEGYSEYDVLGLQFRVNAERIDYIRLFNGSGRSREAWMDNCRAKRVMITRDNRNGQAEIEDEDIIYEGPIEDLFGMQKLYVSPQYDNSRPTKYIDISFPSEMSGYKLGRKFYDFPLSEFEVYGK